MRKYKLYELKELIKNGFAHDLTYSPPTEVLEQLKHAEKIGYSVGVYGTNGYLFQNTDTGEYYAIAARTTNLFRV